MIRQFSLVEPLSIYNFKFIFDHLVGRVYQNYMSNVNQNPVPHNGSGSCYLP